MTTHGRIQVFVHLARGFGRDAWKQRWDRGEIVGINHGDPYGYRQAEQMGCVVEQSEDYPENLLSRCLRLITRAILGFDLLHAWKNRNGIFGADVVWTHTESQALSVLLLACLYASAPKKAKVIAQTVWLMDGWESYSFARKAFYRRLLQRADVLTFHSTYAVAKAQQLFPDAKVELVKYGIRADQSLARIDREAHAPIRILSMGNDRHRDWATFVSTIQNNPRYLAKLVTKAKIDHVLADANNISRQIAATNPEFMALLNWADLVIVSLVDNLHASGITVIEEAVLCGIPVICTDVGGLRSYFSSDEVTYIPTQDPHAMRSAIEMLVADTSARRKKAKRALARMKSGDLNSWSFVARHVELSSNLLEERQVDLTSEGLLVAGGRR